MEAGPMPQTPSRISPSPSEPKDAAMEQARSALSTKSKDARGCRKTRSSRSKGCTRGLPSPENTDDLLEAVRIMYSEYKSPLQSPLSREANGQLSRQLSWHSKVSRGRTPSPSPLRWGAQLESR